MEALDLCRVMGVDIGATIAELAWETAAKALRGAPLALEIAIFDRKGGLVARTPFRAAHS